MPTNINPGFSISFREGSVIPVVTTPSTEKLLILGTALDGPIGVPIAVTDGSAVETTFGPVIYSGNYTSPNGSGDLGKYSRNTLVRAINEALSAGCTNILACRYSGNYATSMSAFGSSFAVYSRYPGRIYNGATIAFASGATTCTVTLTQPSEKGGVYSVTYPSTITIQDVIDRVNTDPFNATFSLVGQYPVALSNLITTLNGTETISGGTYGTDERNEDFGTSKVGLYDLLNDQGSNLGIYSLIKEYEFDIAVLEGLYADDVVSLTAPTTTTAAQPFAQFLHDCSAISRPCFGVIGLRPIRETRRQNLINFVNNNYLSTTSGYISEDAGGYLKWIKMGYFMYNKFTYTETDGATTDLGARLAVFAGPDFVMTNSKLGTYIESGATVYASMLTQLPAAKSALWQKIPFVLTLGAQFPIDLINDLSAGVGADSNHMGGRGAYTAATRNADLGGIIIACDDTAADRGDIYLYQQITHAVNKSVQAVRRVARPFIGSPNVPQTRTALSSMIRSALEALSQQGVLLGTEGIGYEFTVSAGISDIPIGVLNITLRLRVGSSIRTINIYVTVTK